MFWNKNNITKKQIFDKEGTADSNLGLFYDNQECESCPPFCCFTLEGSSDHINLEGLDCCVAPEGCGSTCISFFQALINIFVPAQ